MKKASKLLLVLMAVLLATVFVGCKDDGGGGGSGFSNPKDSSTEIKTFYIPVLDNKRDEGYKDLSEIARLHIHVPKGSGFKIEKVFVSNSRSTSVPSGAVVWNDFTLGPDDHWTGNYGGTIAAGTIADGVWSLDNSSGIGQAYAGNIGIAADGMAYIGFRIANYSADSKFNWVQLEFMKEGDISYQSKSAGYFFGIPEYEPEAQQGPEVDLTDWTPAFFDIEDATVNTIRFHINTGYVEIQKIMKNATKTTVGATTIFDFTNSTPVTTDGSGIDVYWEELTGDVEDVGTANGRFVFASSGTYANKAFATAAAPSDTVWIFVIRTTSEDTADLGDARVDFLVPGDTSLGVVDFKDFDF